MKNKVSHFVLEKKKTMIRVEYSFRLARDTVRFSLKGIIIFRVEHLAK